MDQTIPDWLNKEFLTNCLRGEDTESQHLTINSFDVKAGVAPGNNYGSVILRVKVEYLDDSKKKENSISLIVKGPVTNSMIDAVLELFGMAEYNFYYNYLPELNHIIKDKIIAKTYPTTMKSVIVLEDLKEAGYTMADRQKQLDFDHSKQYFIASAKFHAAGVYLAKKNSDLLKLFPGVFEKMVSTQDFSQMNLFMHDILIGLKCLVKSIEPLGLEEYKPSIEVIKKYIEQNSDPKQEMMGMSLKTVADQNKKMFKSFIHGDCWTTNMMFKHDQSGKPIDILMIDFQGFRYDTVVSDIINFTWMSCNNDVLEHHLEELYNIYCDTLNSKLAEFECPERLSIERLKEEILESSFQVLSMGCMMLPLILHDELIDSTKMFSGKITEEDVMKFYQGDHFFKKFPCVLKFMADQGIFDGMKKQLNQWEQYGDQLVNSTPNNA